MAAFVLHTIFLPPDTRLNLFLQSGVLQDPGLILVRPEFMLGLRGTPLLKLEGSSSTLKSLFPPSGNLVSRVCQSLVPGTYLHSIRINAFYTNYEVTEAQCSASQNYTGQELLVYFES